MFKKDEYFLTDVLDGKMAYCCCRYETIPLETPFSLDTIPKSMEQEGHLVYITHEPPGFYRLFTENKWYCAELVTEEEFIQKKRELSLTSLL